MAWRWDHWSAEVSAAERGGNIQEAAAGTPAHFLSSCQPDGLVLSFLSLSEVTGGGGGGGWRQMGWGWGRGEGQRLPIHLNEPRHQLWLHINLL